MTHLVFNSFSHLPWHFSNVQINKDDSSLSALMIGIHSEGIQQSDPSAQTLSHDPLITKEKTGKEQTRVEISGDILNFNKRAYMYYI